MVSGPPDLHHQAQNSKQTGPVKSPQIKKRHVFLQLDIETYSPFSTVFFYYSSNCWWKFWRAITINSKPNPRDVTSLPSLYQLSLSVLPPSFYFLSLFVPLLLYQCLGFFPICSSALRFIRLISNFLPFLLSVMNLVLFSVLLLF